MRGLFWVVALLLLYPTSVFAQAIVLERGDAYTVVVDHDGVNTTEYRMYAGLVGGTLMLAPAPVPQIVSVDGVRQVRFVYPAGVPAAMADGSYQVVIAAFGNGVEARAPALTITVRSTSTPTGPTAPTNPRITKP